MKTLAASFMAMLFVDTIGALDPFGGKVYLPSPRVYLATFLLWGILGLVALFGAGPKRLARGAALLTLVSAAVLGPFGRKAVTFLDASSTFLGGTK